MSNRFDTRHSLVGLTDELIRLGGRMKATFAGARREKGLGDSEMAVLNAVVEAERPPTVPQIGRSFGQPRQVIQRATNSLIAAGLIETAPNPDHKRAVLLRPTERGILVKRDIDLRADVIAGDIGEGVDGDTVRQATALLNTIRRQLEDRLRTGGDQ